MPCGLHRKQEHMVTARQRLLVRNSWELMRPVAIHVADLFYDRLFELDPSLEGLFSEDLEVQRPRFIAAVGSVVQELDDMEGLQPTLLELGRRYGSQGIKAGTYITLGKALLWTMEQILAEDFTPPVKDAWAALYAAVSTAMLQGAEPREAPKPRERTLRAM